jgi:hypothetical protein
MQTFVKIFAGKRRLACPQVRGCALIIGHVILLRPPFLLPTSIKFNHHGCGWTLACEFASLCGLFIFVLMVQQISSCGAEKCSLLEFAINEGFRPGSVPGSLKLLKVGVDARCDHTTMQKLFILIVTCM